MKLQRSLAATVLFIGLLGIIYYTHVTFWTVNVVFYAAIKDAVTATLFAALALFVTPYFKPLGTFEKAQLLLIWLLMGYSFAISVPTVIDRSLSFYILEKLQQRGGGITQASFEEVFTKEYMKEHRLVDVRLTEQLESGTIIIENGCVKLTTKGQLIASVSRFYRQNLLPKRRLLMGKYSDDLTNPFRNSADATHYQCE